MEKALNVLKELCLVINFNSYWKPRVDEAIAETEEAMKPKECSIECKHLILGMNSCGSTVTCKKDYRCKRVSHLLKDEFELKDNK